VWLRPAGVPFRRLTGTLPDDERALAAFPEDPLPLDHDPQPP
jgi:hypothetical protein